jgi:hypothetical protein
MFDQELDYHGITSAKGIITDPRSLGATIKSFAKKQVENDMFLLAVECYYQVCQYNDAYANYYQVQLPQDHKFSRRSIAKEEWKLLEQYLDMYFGIALTQVPQEIIGNFPVYVKK